MSVYFFFILIFLVKKTRKTLANFEYVFVNGVKVEVEFNLANRMVNSQVVIDKNLRCEILAIQHKPARIMLRRQTETAPRRTNRKPPARRSTIAARAEPIQPTIPVPTEPAHNDAVGNVEIADLHDDFDDFDDAQMDFDGGDGLNNINFSLFDDIDINGILPVDQELEVIFNNNNIRR